MINIYNDDCFNVFPKIADKSIELVLCDMPYGTTNCKWDIIIDLELMWKNINRIVKDNAAILLFGQNPFTAKLISSNIDNYRYDIIWTKDSSCNFMFGNKQPLKKHELISVFYKKQPIYNPQKTLAKKVSKRHLYGFKLNEHQKEMMGANYKFKFNNNNAVGAYNMYGKNYEPNKLLPTSIIYYSTERNVTKKTHPTQKPVKMLEYLINTYSNVGDTVLDFCMGTGSCGVAAKNLNRNFIGIEKELKYFEIAKQKLI